MFFLYHTVKVIPGIAALLTVKLKLLRKSLRMKKAHKNYKVLQIKEIADTT